MNVTTIEQTVEKALFDSELILEQHFDNLQKIKWSRAARTDKGVHAIANFVSCKLSITPKYLDIEEKSTEQETQVQGQELSKLTDKEKINWEKLINTINSNLPSSVRVQTIKRITKAFDVKISARSRIYEYLAPTSMFIKDIKEDNTEIEQKTLERLQVLVQKFKGTHNFHNYTHKMRANDPKANRYIMEMNCELLDFKEKGKYYKFTIRGQSFIYHQIRKIIGIMAQVLHGDLKDQFIDNSFYQNAVAIWLAPPQGLFLNRVTFEAYNRKIDIPEKLEFNEEEEAKLKDFRDNYIIPLIIDAELTNKTTWLEQTKTLQAEGKILAVESSGEEDDDEEEKEGDKKGGRRKDNNRKNRNTGGQNKNQVSESKETVEETPVETISKEIETVKEDGVQ